MESEMNTQAEITHPAIVVRYNDQPIYVTAIEHDKVMIRFEHIVVNGVECRSDYRDLHVPRAGLDPTEDYWSFPVRRQETKWKGNSYDDRVSATAHKKLAAVVYPAVSEFMTETVRDQAEIAKRYYERQADDRKIERFEEQIADVRKHQADLLQEMDMISAMGYPSFCQVQQDIADRQRQQRNARDAERYAAIAERRRQAQEVCGNG
jgi:hypothetical protein